MRNLPLFVFLFLYAAPCSAQDFEIRANYAGTNIVEVQMRSTTPAPTMANFVLDIVFGLKWQNTYNVNLGAPTGIYSISKSGGELVSGVYEYQAFYANNTPYNFPEDWPDGAWKTIITIPVSQTGTGFGTFEIAQVGFNPTTNPNINVDGVDYTPTINGAAVSVPLPVELLDFSSRKQGKQVLLTWHTANESGSKGFHIEHSLDGILWQKIGWLDGANESLEQREYTFLHTNPSQGINYYQLAQLDYSGEIILSKVVLEKFESLTGFIANPNPVNHELTLFFEQNDSDFAQLSIFDAIGRLVFISKDFNSELKLNTSTWAAGIYELEVIHGETRNVKKFVVQH